MKNKTSFKKGRRVYTKAKKDGMDKCVTCIGRNSQTVISGDRVGEGRSKPKLRPQALLTTFLAYRRPEMWISGLHMKYYFYMTLRRG